MARVWARQQEDRRGGEQEREELVVEISSDSEVSDEENL